jgi:hypothetical protein
MKAKESFMDAIFSASLPVLCLALIVLCLFQGMLILILINGFI